MAETWIRAHNDIQGAWQCRGCLSMNCPDRDKCTVCGMPVRETPPTEELRDRFAMAALGLDASDDVAESDSMPQTIAEHAYAIADAMLKARGGAATSTGPAS